MLNGINTQFNSGYTNYTVAPPQNPASKVNIFVYTEPMPPQQGFYQDGQHAQYPYTYNNLIKPNDQSAKLASSTVQPPAQEVASAAPTQAQGLNMNNNIEGVAGQSQGAKPVEAQNKIELTDDYIKSLEQKMKSADPKDRLKAATEVLNRFKEDETRKQDEALTPLLNAALADPADETVKYVALAALDSGYATGDSKTREILNNIKNSKDSFPEDAALAGKILEGLNNVVPVQITPALTQNQNGLNIAGKNPPESGILMNEGGSANKVM